MRATKEVQVYTISSQRLRVLEHKTRDPLIANRAMNGAPSVFLRQERRQDRDDPIGSRSKRQALFAGHPPGKSVYFFLHQDFDLLSQVDEQLSNL
jgi:hypothetical protein